MICSMYLPSIIVFVFIFVFVFVFVFFVFVFVSILSARTCPPSSINWALLATQPPPSFSTFEHLKQFIRLFHFKMFEMCRNLIWMRMFKSDLNMFEQTFGSLHLSARLMVLLYQPGRAGLSEIWLISSTIKYQTTIINHQLQIKQGRIFRHLLDIIINNTSLLPSLTSFWKYVREVMLLASHWETWHR